MKLRVSVILQLINNKLWRVRLHESISLAGTPMLQTLAPVMRAALVLLSICAMAGTKKAAKSLVTQVADQKEFKKLLRTKTQRDGAVYW